MVIDLSSVKDWIYVICIPIQTLFGLVFFHWWWDRRKAKQAQKREDDQKEEDRQKADEEKIAAILGEKYDEVGEIYHRFKRMVDRLEQNSVGTLTEFDVLLYMCRPDNWDEFSQRQEEDKYVPRQFLPMDTRPEVMSDVNKIMKLFLQFRINLSSVMQNKACPADIKLEFSNDITEMGRAIYPFVEKHRQDVIERVLRYFEVAATVEKHASMTETPSPSSSQCCGCFPCRSVPDVSKCCGRQETHEVETVRLIRYTRFEPSTLGPKLRPYRGNTEIKLAIPYIKHFRYEGGKMVCNLRCQYLAISTLAICVQKGKIEGDIYNCILDEIRKLLRDANRLNDLLHWVRIVMFKVLEYSAFAESQAVKSFDTYVKSRLNVGEKGLNKERCKRALQDLASCISNLENENADVEAVLEVEDTAVFLEAKYEQMSEFFRRALNPRLATE